MLLSINNLVIAKTDAPLVNPFKGLEIYAWVDSQGNHNYSLLEGTNKLKTFQDLSSHQIRPENIILNLKQFRQVFVAINPSTQQELETNFKLCNPNKEFYKQLRILEKNGHVILSYHRR